MSVKIGEAARAQSWSVRRALLRNRILGSARFQRWAAATPLIRGIARRRAADQFDLVAGFVYAQILYAFAETDLIAFIGCGVRDTDSVAVATGLAHPAAERLLKAGAALRLVERVGDDAWVLGNRGAPILGNPSVLDMVRHHRALYADLADPLALLRDRGAPTHLSRYWNYGGEDSAGDPGQALDYSALMASTQAMIAEQVVKRYRFAQHRRMLDIGGGTGGFALAVAAIAPQLPIGIFDLPPVVAAAKDRLAAQGLAPRIDLFAGSFRDDPIPDGADLITLIRILHDHDDDVVTALLAKARTALPPGGTLLIAEPLAETRGAEAMGDAYFGLYLWAMRSGRPRTVQDYSAMLAHAGFGQIREIATDQPLITRILIAN